MDFKSFDIAVTVLVVLSCWEGIKWGINFGLKKITGNEYMTRKECESNHSEENETVEQIKKDLTLVRQVLLMVALNQPGVDKEQLSKLVQ